MVSIFRFAAVRPEPGRAGEIGSVPYDVVTAEEAGDCIRVHPDTFLQVIRPDAECPGIDPRDERVYRRAQDNFERMRKDGLFFQDREPGYYLYRIVQSGEEFVGLVACVSCDDYVSGRIRRHELTRYDKEEDRSRHIDQVNANTGLVFLLYRDPDGGIHSTIASSLEGAAGCADVTTDHGVVHQIYRITDVATLARIEERLSAVDSLYIADGHHRAKSAVNVAGLRQKEGRFTEESGKFMAVLFAESRVNVHGYSRLVTDLGGMTPERFIRMLDAQFTVTEYGSIDGSAFQIAPLHASTGHEHIIHMYLDSRWYELAMPLTQASSDPLETLDVTVLQDMVLEKGLGITDPRKDPRLHYLGGAKPLSNLESMVDSGEFAVAFAMQPIPVRTILRIADEREVMPPKSTWFEPKLFSGLVIHTLK